MIKTNFRQTAGSLTFTLEHELLITSIKFAHFSNPKDKVNNDDLIIMDAADMTTISATIMTSTKTTSTTTLEPPAPTTKSSTTRNKLISKNQIK